MRETKIVEYIIGTFVAVIFPSGTFLLIALAMIIVDSFFGILTLKKRNDTFSLKKLLIHGILIKASVYCAIILLLYWADTILIDSIIDKHHIVTKVGTLFILMNEIGSIIKHFKLLTGSEFKKNFNLLNSIINGFRKLVKNLWK